MKVEMRFALADFINSKYDMTVITNVSGDATVSISYPIKQP